MKWTAKQRAEMKAELIQILTEVMDELEDYGGKILVSCDQHDFKQEMDHDFFRSTAEEGIAEKMIEIANRRKEMSEILTEANNILLFGNEEEEDED